MEMIQTSSVMNQQSQYVDNLIKILGQVKRVLKKSGSCLVVLSDKFNNGGDGGGDTKRSREEKGGFVNYKDRSIPDGSLCNIPSRFATAMTDTLGFVQKNDIIWEKLNGFSSVAASYHQRK
jgi:DNA modification methylase